MQQSDPDPNKWSYQMDLCQLFIVKKNNDKGRENLGKEKKRKEERF
jgi:hypothetical protein